LSVYWRWQVRDTAGGNADIVAAKAIRGDIVDEYTAYGVK